MHQRLKALPKDPLPIASCLIFDHRNRLLLLRRHVDDLGGGMWAAPGGKQEPDEDPRLAATREAEEETGLKLSDITYLGTHELKMPHGVVHIRSFMARLEDEPDIILNADEHDAYEWFELSTLIEAERIIWGLPTTLLDFGLLESLTDDITLADGSQAVLLERAA